MDLRKVDGEKNPADLLTKHSLSRARLLKLVELFGCEYLGGRAESAPKLRRGEGNKVTMADADNEINTADRPAADRTPSVTPSVIGASTLPEDEITEEEQVPMMPHITYSESDLEVLYPRLLVPIEEALEDDHERQAEAQDDVLQYGLRVAEEIRKAMTDVGRTRRPDAASTQ